MKGVVDQLFLYAVSVVTEAFFVHGFSYGLSQSRQPIFEQIVGRAVLHTLDGAFFADTARHNDKGHIQSAFLQMLEGPLRIELRKGVISQDNIQLLVQMRKEISFRFHSLPLRIKTRSQEFVNHQFRILLAVLKDEHVERRSHHCPRCDGEGGSGVKRIAHARFPFRGDGGGGSSQQPVNQGAGRLDDCWKSTATMKYDAECELQQAFLRGEVIMTPACFSYAGPT